MILKKPYAFFIKYFRFINFILVILVGFLIYKLMSLNNVINQIYNGIISNFSNLSSEYIGYSMYLLLFIIFIVLFSMILLLKYKNKPFKDYLFLFLYNIIIVIYLFNVDNIFMILLNSIVEQTKLDLYSDISFIIFLPLFYFLIKYILISIGFNLKKFDFTNDILELKAEETDGEEVELIFDKNTYKYKRNIRKYFREFKYYILENKMFMIIIFTILVSICFVVLLRVNKNNNKVSLNETFVSNSISYKIMSVYETKYDLKSKVIKDGYKYVIINADIKNLISESQSINLKNIRLVYGKDYSYASTYYNKYFNDIGKPYNNERIFNNSNYNYIFIFQVPESYNSNKYDIKFYNGVSYNDGESNAVYKTLSVNAESFDGVKVNKKFTLGDNTILNKEKYGNSNLTIKSYEIQNIYIDKSTENSMLIKPNDLNDVLLVLDYDLFIDDKTVLYDLFSTSYDFFNKFLKVEYKYNGIDKKVKNGYILKSNINDKLFVSVPYEINNAQEIRIILSFRDLDIIYKIK